MRSPLPPALANIFMDNFETRALQATSFKPKLWIGYVNGTLVIWPHGERELDNLLNHLNGVHTSENKIHYEEGARNSTTFPGHSNQEKTRRQPIAYSTSENDTYKQIPKRSIAPPSHTTADSS
ncbi:hypothetical protein Trydic_g16204 [Trypoxylus dichotomus]